MSDQAATAEDLRHAFGFWIRNNIGFLARYWHTATEALQKVAEAPEEFSEFEDNELGPSYVAAVLDSHLENHNYSGVLLTYSIFDEFMTVLAGSLGAVRSAPIGPHELRDRGVRRYKKFIHKVCRVRDDEADIDWGLLQDLAVVRNAIIHAHGNKSLVGNSNELEAVVRRRPGLSFKHQVRLVVSKEFVLECIWCVRDTALTVNALAKPSTENEDAG